MQNDQQTKLKRKERDLLIPYCIGEKVLDVGCGVEKVKPECIGIDTYPYEAADIVHRCDDLWFFKDGEIDSIVGSHIFEHMADCKVVMKEWTRVLRVGGRLTLILPNAEFYPRTILEESHKQAFTPLTIKYLFKYFNYRIKRLDVLPEETFRRKPILISGIKQ